MLVAFTRIKQKYLFFLSTIPVKIGDSTHISMHINEHTLTHARSFLTRCIFFFQNNNANVLSILTVATCLFPYIIVTVWQHNLHQFTVISLPEVTQSTKYVVSYLYLYCLRIYRNHSSVIKEYTIVQWLIYPSGSKKTRLCWWGLNQFINNLALLQ